MTTASNPNVHDDCQLGAVFQKDAPTRFRVWAPQARRIALKILDHRPSLASMQPAGSGYFEASVEGLQPGTRYCYRLNDAVDRPDPASRFQPTGVHGPSAVTSRDFSWTDSQWGGRPWEEYVIYEAHVGTFTTAGTFQAMVAHLDELVRLGVTALELMPVAQFPGERNWGYDGVHPFAPQNTYGGPDGLKLLVDACHARSLAVVLDVVYNHLGPEGNYFQEFGPYFTDRHHTPWGAAINFDGRSSDPVREFFISNALYWFSEFHIDALRLDATHAIVDESARPLLAELADAVRACGERLNRRVFTIAEHHSNDPRVVSPVTVGGYGLDAQLLDDFQHSLHALATGEQVGCYCDFGQLDDFAKAYGTGFVLTGQHSKYRGCRWGADSADVRADRFVAFAQNHDTVGNRPRAERLGRLVSFEDLKLAAAAVILSPAIPMLFMGEEYDEPAPFFYFTSHIDARLAAAVRDGRQKEFTNFNWPGTPSDPQSPETFARSRLTRSLASSGHHAILWKFYQELLRLRKELPALRQAARELGGMLVLEDAGAIIAHRRAKATQICLCMNFGQRALDVVEQLPTVAGWHTVLDSSEAQWLGPRSGRQSDWSPPAPLILNPKSCLLLAASEH